ncbi:MAG TPA: FkbM family methyltransferase [Magnetospirillaceae bacterium]|jgi:FkbM family methyltransferase
MTMRVIESRHGSFIVQDNDHYVGRSLTLYGEYSEGEWALLRQLVKPGDTVVEAGANIGAHTVPLAKAVEVEGRVYAFEPQRLIHQMLAGNLALNAIENTHTFAIALGDRAGQVRIPLIHYGADENYGGVSVQNDGGEAVAMGTIDTLRLDRLDLLKIDVEGAEFLVLRGAEATIKRTWPPLYLENDRRDQSPALLAYLIGLGYEIWWHVPPLFNSGNHFGNADNVFGEIRSVNILCLHKTRASKPPEGVGLFPVNGVDDWVLPS